MTIQRQIDRLTAQRASEWIETLEKGGAQERAAFVDWLRESRRHVSEFLSVVALDRELDRMDLKDLVELDALLKRVSPGVARMRTATVGARGEHGRRGLGSAWKTAFAAGIAALALALAWTLKGAAPAQDFVTVVGEQRAIELQDGSVLQLNAQTHMQVQMRDSERNLRLLSGEALFTVARDPVRPFRVHTRDAVVEALGTQFSVVTGEHDTTVSVLEGRVQVSSKEGGAALKAGEQALIDDAGSIQRRLGMDASAATAWRQKRLVFKRTAIEDVVREFNRYNVSPKLRLEGGEPGSRHYSATFDADDPESFGELLGREPGVTIEKRPGEIIIRSR